MSGDRGNEDANRWILKHSGILGYFSEEYPSFIILLVNQYEDNDCMELPRMFVESTQVRVRSNVVLQLPNGHETHVHYNKKKNMLLRMREFFKYCQHLFGSIMVFSYKGNGKFLVSFLKDDLCEVIYFKNRTIVRGTMFDQGVGWKFLVNLDNPANPTGQIAVPARFWRMFGSNIPEKVHFIMRNGSRFEGECLQTVRKMYGLQDLVKGYGLSKSEKLMLTYFGGGSFFVMVFDSSDVEAMLMTLDSEKSDENTKDTMEGFNDNDGQNNIEDVADVEKKEESVSGMTFVSIMNPSDVDSTPHGPYVQINPQTSEKRWRDGDEVILRTADYDWEVGIVMSNQIPRFSSGWNLFAIQNEIKLWETVIFNMAEDSGNTVFSVSFPQRD